MEKTKWSKKIEMAKIKLVDEKHPAEELFAAMKITRPMIEQSETGAVVVSVRASSEQVYKIGKNKAVIDGIIIAKLVSKGGAGGVCSTVSPSGGDSKWSGAREAVRYLYFDSAGPALYC